MPGKESTLRERGYRRSYPYLACSKKRRPERRSRHRRLVRRGRVVLRVWHDRVLLVDVPNSLGGKCRLERRAHVRRVAQDQDWWHGLCDDARNRLRSHARAPTRANVGVRAAPHVRLGAQVHDRRKRGVCQHRSRVRKQLVKGVRARIVKIIKVHDCRGPFTNVRVAARALHASNLDATQCVVQYNVPG